VRLGGGGLGGSSWRVGGLGGGELWGGGGWGGGVGGGGERGGWGWGWGGLGGVGGGRKPSVEYIFTFFPMPRFSTDCTRDLTKRKPQRKKFPNCYFKAFEYPRVKVLPPSVFPPICYNFRDPRLRRGKLPEGRFGRLLWMDAKLQWPNRNNKNGLNADK